MVCRGTGIPGARRNRCRSNAAIGRLEHARSPAVGGQHRHRRPSSPGRRIAVVARILDRLRPAWDAADESVDDAWHVLGQTVTCQSSVAGVEGHPDEQWNRDEHGCACVMRDGSSEQELRSLMCAGLDGDADAHRRLLVDLSNRLRGIEVKAAATVNASDFKGLRKLADATGNALRLGLVLYDGEQTVPFGDHMFAAPVSCVWG